MFFHNENTNRPAGNLTYSLKVFFPLPNLNNQENKPHHISRVAFALRLFFPEPNESTEFCHAMKFPRREPYHNNERVIRATTR